MALMESNYYLVKLFDRENYVIAYYNSETKIWNVTGDPEYFGFDYYENEVLDIKPWTPEYIELMG